MALVCPACNKANQTEATCQRCGCDLGPLHGVAGASAAHLGAALDALRAGDWEAALGAAGHSWRLVHSHEAARVGFLAAAAGGRTDQALRWHARARSG